MKATGLLLVACLAGAADASEEPDYVRRYREVRSQADTALQAIDAAIQREYDPARTREEQANRLAPLHEESRTVLAAAVERSLRIVAVHASDDAAVEPLAWIAGRHLPREAVAAATSLLADHHPVHADTIALAKRLAIGPGGARAEPLIRSQLASPQLPPDQRWKLQLALARHYQEEADFIRYLNSDHDAVTPLLKRVYGARYLEELGSADAALFDRKAVAEFELLRKADPDQEYRLGVTVSQFATSAIFAIENLQVGKWAPDITGDSLAGELMSLSDYRGKVVLLSFWATWCGPCMAEVPQQRRLVEAYADRPFAIVGVNADREVESVLPTLEENKITWESFWNGPEGPVGSITRAWHVTGWPTNYLLDHRGVIRGKSLRGPRLDTTVDELVAEAEAGESP